MAWKIFGDWSKGDFFADDGVLGGVRDNQRNDYYQGVRWQGQDGKIWYKDHMGTHTRGPARHTFYRDIADPVKHTPRGGANDNINSTPDLRHNVYDTGGGSRASRQQLAEYEQGIDQANHNLGRVGTQLGIRRANTHDAWRKKMDALDSSVAMARHQYDTQREQNFQNRRNEVNLINDSTATGLRGILSVLGARGANGSDIEKVARVAQDKATRERANSGAQFAKNAQNLDINWQNFNQDIDKERREINDWKVNEERAAERDAETSRQGLHNLLAQLRSQQAEARGQNGANAARADLARARELSGNIDNLARIQTTHHGKDVIYKPQSLDSYKVQGDTVVKVGDSTGQSGDTAANVYDTKQKEDERKKHLHFL